MCGGISGAKMTHMRRFKPFLHSIGIPTKPLIAKENLVISRGHTYPAHLGTSPRYHKQTTRKKK